MQDASILVRVGKHKEIKEIRILGLKDSFQIRSDHPFGISIISLSPEDAIELKDEIGEWLASRKQDIRRAELEYS